MLPSLAAGMSLLDVGCGPGTITLDLAARVAPGRVVGIDREPAVLVDGAGNVEFQAGDVYGLEFGAGEFDVVHVHQVLHHVTDPVAALREIRRVLKPGGLLAVRESYYAGFTWAPAEPLLDRWLALFRDVCAHNGADADAGSRLLGWARRAGFDDARPSSSTWIFADADDRAWWGEMWAERMLESGLAEQALAYELSTPEELKAISDAWRRWAGYERGYFIAAHGELLARR